MTDPREELVEHIGSMRAFAMSLARNSALADDLVQDAMLKAWANIDKFEPGTNMRAWLFTILRNIFYSHHRKAKREVADVDGEIAASVAQKPDHDGRLQMKEFSEAFAELNEEQREALVLIGASGFSYEEAAEMCGVAIGTMKSRVNRARARLAELMDVDENEAMEATDAVTHGIVAAQQNIA